MLLKSRWGNINRVNRKQAVRRRANVDQLSKTERILTVRDIFKRTFSKKDLSRAFVRWKEMAET
ncbi:hypothetical protein CH063_04446 [Colletotrichum higginsianum]|uniref:Uncharacterized protein n=1 Tax=Colletotrichum higginsianum (strain IMI 349063) TaxID=759273 RepID=H1UVH4_COLHI|nr:hypothetical protein CH063_04446 [Colletotrichum higginsianum]